MAVLKYKNGAGEFVTLTNYTVQPLVPVNTTGTSISDVMSQKAVTDELNNKASLIHTHAVADITGLSDAINNNESVSDAKDFADFNTGHNTNQGVANIPTTKRLVIVNGVTVNANNMSLDGTLEDGYELHVIVYGTPGVEITLPNSGNWVSVIEKLVLSDLGNNVGYCEFNIISDGTNLYVRGI